MKVNHYEQVAKTPVTMEGARGCQVRWLVDESQGAPNFAMRQFEVAPGGYTPKHSHPYEHEVFVLEGRGTVLEGDVEHRLEAGDFVLVSPNEVHQFLNTGAVPLKFLCMVPNSSAAQKVTVAAECSRPVK
ncbi:MAG: cupin domain-containing protein [Planctomycetia bacterium]|nr:cupin domain-containing protein [Planctomycetia bacterium]